MLQLLYFDMVVENKFSELLNEQKHLYSGLSPDAKILGGTFK